MKHPKKSWWAGLLIILAGGAMTVLLVAGEEKEPLIDIHAPVQGVETRSVRLTDYRVRIPAWGFVQPREIIDIRTEIAGKVTRVSADLFAGAKVKRGTFLFAIDARDYQNILAEAMAIHEQARQDLAIEAGMQVIAQSEWELLQQSKWLGRQNKPLALREPQLKARQAAVQIAAAKQALAALDVERARITAPCDGVILMESLAKGQVLDTGHTALRLACTDRYQIVASFSAQFQLDPKVRTVSIDIGSDPHAGFIQSELPRIDHETRQKQTLVVFDGDDIVLDAYASLTLPGPHFKHVAVLPDASLRPGNSVWVLRDNGTLEVRAVTVLARDRMHIVIGDGLKAGEQVILSHIASPLQGMPLRPVAPAAADRRIQASSDR